MDLGVVLSLVVLALIDATSFGTLGLPAVMLAQRRIRVAVVLAYLATIAVFYWVVGALLLTGVAAIGARAAAVADRPWGSWVQLVVGVALVAGLVEVASMLPYLAAIGFLSQSSLSLPGRAGLLVGYCLVMVTPALLLMPPRAAGAA